MPHCWAQAIAWIAVTQTGLGYTPTLVDWED